jgi:hypothetical protein
VSAPDEAQGLVEHRQGDLDRVHQLGQVQVVDRRPFGAQAALDGQRLDEGGHGGR